MRFDRRNFLALTIGAAAAAGTARAAGRSTITLADGAAIAKAPFQLIDNRIFLDATINGAGPFSMILDTGGSNIVTPEVARAAGLAFGEGFQIDGAGAGTLPAWPTHVSAVANGAFAMREIGFTILPLDTIRDAIGFARLDGLFGHELLGRFIVRIDYDAAEIAFAERSAVPNGWREGGGIPFNFVGTLPSIEAECDGAKGRYVIDTGDRSSLTLFAPHVERNGLRSRARFRGVTGFGVGGPILADVMRVGRFVMGGRVVEGVTTRMPGADSGAFGTDMAAGSIGTGVMKRFASVYDYAARRIYLAEGARAAAPDPVDLAGLWIAAEAGAGRRSVTVHSVDQDGPAAKAGIAARDRIETVDGRAASEIGVIGLRARFAEGPTGTRVALGLKRGEAALSETIALADRLA